MDNALSTEFCQLSFNAVSGESMKIRALVKDQVMPTLIDSGSHHNFVSEEFLHRVGITHLPATPKHVRVANGEVMMLDKCVPQLS